MRVDILVANIISTIWTIMLVCEILVTQSDHQTKKIKK